MVTIFSQCLSIGVVSSQGSHFQFNENDYRSDDTSIPRRFLKRIRISTPLSRIGWAGSSAFVAEKRVLTMLLFREANN